ncbi:MAG: GIY-YIG nuclease family protein [Candidatus Woesebacteria bacterium]|nr:GIY-YIG nuclease family protein [Candidatus Woesebacteria bacterium]
MVYTYLLKSLRDGSFYVGITNNLQSRLKNHNKGYVKATYSKRPYELAFFRCHTDYAEARKHEIWLKKKNVVYKNKLTTIGRELIPPSQTG